MNNKDLLLSYNKKPGPPSNKTNVFYNKIPILEIENAPAKFSCLVHGLLSQAKVVPEIRVKTDDHQFLFPITTNEPSNYKIKFDEYGLVNDSSFGYDMVTYAQMAYNIARSFGVESPILSGKITGESIGDFSGITDPFILCVGEAYEHLAVPFGEGLGVGHIICEPPTSKEKYGLALHPMCKAVVGNAGEDAAHILLHEYKVYPKAKSYKAKVLVHDDTVKPIDLFFWPTVLDVPLNDESKNMVMRGQVWKAAEENEHLYYRFARRGFRLS